MARRSNRAGSESQANYLPMSLLFLIDAGVLLFMHHYMLSQDTFSRYLTEEQLRWPIYLALASLALSLAFFLLWYLVKRKVRALQRAITDLSEGSPSVTPKDFLRNKASLAARGDYTGVYVIHNTTKDKYYVGQSVRVIGRISQHFTGHGNGDVYADYKYGDDFTIKTIPLVGSGYDSLDALERMTISTFDAYNKGYNRTRGNRN